MTDTTHDRHTTSATHRAGTSVRLVLGLVLVGGDRGVRLRQP